MHGEGSDRAPSGADRPTDRLTVQPAAVLGISEEAVGGRIKRRTLMSDRDGDGRVWVILSDERPGGGDQPTGHTDRTDLLIAELQDRVRSLEEANRENRRIMAALTSRIPALEAAETPESPVPTDAPSEASGETQTGTQEPRRRSWWREYFGFGE
jgi:hypothetical protein